MDLLPLDLHEVLDANHSSELVCGIFLQSTELFGDGAPNGFELECFFGVSEEERQSIGVLVSKGIPSPTGLVPIGTLGGL